MGLCPNQYNQYDYLDLGTGGEAAGEGAEGEGEGAGEEGRGGAGGGAGGGGGGQHHGRALRRLPVRFRRRCRGRPCLDQERNEHI